MESFVAKGINGQLSVTTDKVIINRRGAMAFLTQGLKGDKEIRLDQIGSIQLKKAGLAFNGFIQFTFLGGKESKGGLVDATQDENTIMFRRGQQGDFLKAKDLIDQYCVQLRQPRAQLPAPSAADEIAKFAALLKDGLITEAEFNAKKQQLLGL